ncbi:MAG: bifunctional alpha,alpha-trehalose-phosphate synthase (UDP-forming)/trehalose-phosphatase [Deltaproteobacteria bacterium]|nr:bifunctional alpha,alpha-trehalose-phosphate synthase (UDP-forming)/trehalose-phosphatase [Deltaproteobacteria bacterium]
MKLIVVSNREPYVHRRTGDTISVERPAGGLTSALDNVLKTLNGTWLAWGSGSGDREIVDNRGRVPVPPSSPAYVLKRVWLSPNEVDNYYTGYSNRVLWPLSHLTLDRVYYRRQYWDSYRRVNQKFADSIVEETGEEEVTLWVHDYHLCLVPSLVKQAAPSVTIGHFWHIPWPDWGTFRILPQAKDVLEGLLANDLLGFQIPLFVKNFMNCAKESLDAGIDYVSSSVTYNGHRTLLRAFPVSVDFAFFDAAAASKKAYAIRRLKEHLGITAEYIGIGVDRLEYTKALLKRLQAIDLFFEKYHSFIGRFVFIQVAVPTRLSEPYISYKKSVEGLIARINDKYSTAAWKPIVYITTKIEHRDLALYYRIADVAIISSVYDGMNLVAKEYIASQSDEKGVIILSEFAGASEELIGSLPLNPYDIETFAGNIKKALLMPVEEKRSRMRALREHVKTNDLRKWTGDFISAIEGCHRELHGAEGGMFLFLDYDGTLAPIADRPQAAVLDKDVRAVMDRLRTVCPMAVVSGRMLSDIMDRVGIKDIIYVGNHGAEIWDGTGIVPGSDGPVDTGVLDEFKERVSSVLGDVDGVVIEDKGRTISVHYRNVDPRRIDRVTGDFRRVADGYADRLRITSGKGVLEARPLDAWDKGDAVSWILRNFGAGRMPVYVGDDATDEDAFRVINRTGVSISIGRNIHAQCYLGEQAEIREFLEWLMDKTTK